MTSKYEAKQRLRANQIDLKEFLEYIENEICSKFYYYKLETGYTIKLSSEIENIPHLLGIHKFFENPDSEKGGDLVKNIMNESITIKSLKRLDKKTFNECKGRIEYFVCINEILVNTNYFIKFNPLQKIPFSKIKSDYLLYSEELGIELLLGILKINETNKEIECVPETFLIDYAHSFSKHQDKSNYEKVENIKIVEKQ